jgi:hypothetical protein
MNREMMLYEEMFTIAHNGTIEFTVTTPNNAYTRVYVNVSYYNPTTNRMEASGLRAIDSRDGGAPLLVSVNLPPTVSTFTVIAYRAWIQGNTAVALIVSFSICRREIFKIRFLTIVYTLAACYLLA